MTLRFSEIKHSISLDDRNLIFKQKFLKQMSLIKKVKRQKSQLSNQVRWWRRGNVRGRRGDFLEATSDIDCSYLGNGASKSAKEPSKDASVDENVPPKKVGKWKVSVRAKTKDKSGDLEADKSGDSSADKSGTELDKSIAAVPGGPSKNGRMGILAMT